MERLFVAIKVRWKKIIAATGKMTKFGFNYSKFQEFSDTMEMQQTNEKDSEGNYKIYYELIFFF